ncbi:MAG: hypothetical protein ACOCP8_04645 [archaeon]
MKKILILGGAKNINKKREEIIFKELSKEYELHILQKNTKYSVKNIKYHTYKKEIESKIIKQLSKVKFDYIYFIPSGPHDQYDLAINLKKELKAKLVWHVYDCIYHKSFHNITTSWYFRFIKKNPISNLKKIEIKTAKETDYFIFVTKQLQELYIKRYGNYIKNNSVVIPNMFFDEKKINTQEIKTKKHKLIYAGLTVYPRLLIPLFKALLFIKTKKQIEFDIYGKLFFLDKYFLKIIRPFLSKKIKINYKGFIPRDELERTLAKEQNPLYIVVDAIYFKKDYPFLPLKTIDYLSFGAKILAITPKNSPSEEVLSKYSKGYVVRFNPIKIARKLEKIFEENLALKQKDYELIDQYNLRKQAHKFNRAFK